MALTAVPEPKGLPLKSLASVTIMPYVKGQGNVEIDFLDKKHRTENSMLKICMEDLKDLAVLLPHEHLVEGIEMVRKNGGSVEYPSWNFDEPACITFSRSVDCDRQDKKPLITISIQLCNAQKKTHQVTSTDYLVEYALNGLKIESQPTQS